MSFSPEHWDERFLNDEISDGRTATERDRDRVLHCEYFWRLAEVTQITGGTKRQLVHNRLTHSLEVSQIAVRIAQSIKRRYESLAKDTELSAAVADIDLSACEVGSLAHDIGHPPFGHLGEKILNKKVIENTNVQSAGYEGNAQSFRILVKLAQRRYFIDGLNLSRRSLNSVLKYPWMFEATNERYSKKYSVYPIEREIFEWARQGLPSDYVTIEAQIMDAADDIAYSIHDLLDYYKVGIIPLHLLAKDDPVWESVCLEIGAHRKKSGKFEIRSEIKNDVRSWLLTFFRHQYDETFYARKRVYMFHSLLFGICIERFSKVTINNSGLIDLEISDEIRHLIEFLKEVTGHYVLRHTELRLAQIGHRKIMADTFDAIKDSYAAAELVLPSRYVELVEDPNSKVELPRVIADYISGLTEGQVLSIHSKLHGTSGTSAFDHTTYS